MVSTARDALRILRDVLIDGERGGIKDDDPSWWKRVDGAINLANTVLGED